MSYYLMDNFWQVTVTFIFVSVAVGLYYERYYGQEQLEGAITAVFVFLVLMAPFGYFMFLQEVHDDDIVKYVSKESAKHPYVKDCFLQSIEGFEVSITPIRVRNTVQDCKQDFENKDSKEKNEKRSAELKNKLVEALK